jgi:hypothetical protein
MCRHELFSLKLHFLSEDNPLYAWELFTESTLGINKIIVSHLTSLSGERSLRNDLTFMADELGDFSAIDSPPLHHLVFCPPALPLTLQL